MPRIDREGIFRANVVEIGVAEPDSGAIGVQMKFDIIDMLVDGEFQDWSGYAFEVYGTVWVVKKDGTLIDKNVESLRDSIGWDCKFETLATEWLPGVACQVVVKGEEYKGKMQFRVEWVNPFDYQGGGGIAKVETSTAKTLDSRFGSALRALGGVKAKSAPAPSWPPSAPRPAAKAAPSPGGSATATKERRIATTMEDAWAVYQSSNITDEKRTAEWEEACAEVAASSGRGYDDFTAVDWQEVADKCIPF